MTVRASDKFVRDVPPAILPAHRIVQTSEVARIGGPHVAHGQPKVDLVRDGEIIKAIDVTCSCGETIRIWCSYEAAP